MMGQKNGKIKKDRLRKKWNRDYCDKCRIGWHEDYAYFKYFLYMIFCFSHLSIIETFSDIATLLNIVPVPYYYDNYCIKIYERT